MGSAASRSGASEPGDAAGPVPARMAPAVPDRPPPGSPRAVDTRAKASCINGDAQKVPATSPSVSAASADGDASDAPDIAAALHAPVSDANWTHLMVVFILGIWNATLFALLYALGVAGTLAVWAVAEAAHFLVYLARVELLSEPAQSHPPDMIVLNTDGARNVQNLYMIGRVMDPWDFILPWFYHADRAAMKRDNFRDLIAYGGFYCTTEELYRAGYGDELEHWTDDILATWGITLPPGKNPDLRIRMHTWEPLRTRHYTLLLYLFSYLCGLWSSFHLHIYGFHKSGDYQVWHLPPRQNGKGQGVRESGGNGAGNGVGEDGNGNGVGEEGAENGVGSGNGVGDEGQGVGENGNGVGHAKHGAGGVGNGGAHEDGATSNVGGLISPHNNNNNNPSTPPRLSVDEWWEYASAEEGESGDDMGGAMGGADGAVNATANTDGASHAPSTAAMLPIASDALPGRRCQETQTPLHPSLPSSPIHMRKQRGECRCDGDCGCKSNGVDGNGNSHADCPCEGACDCADDNCDSPRSTASSASLDGFITSGAFAVAGSRPPGQLFSRKESLSRRHMREAWGATLERSAALRGGIAARLRGAPAMAEAYARRYYEAHGGRALGSLGSLTGSLPQLPAMWGDGGLVARLLGGGEGQGEGAAGTPVSAMGGGGGMGAGEPGWRRRKPVAEKLPIVFLHGIGVGLLPYLPLLRRLSRAFPRHPILTLEMPWVALRVCRVPTPDEVAERIVWDLKRKGFSRAVFVAHSYGTFVLARIVKRFPSAVHNVVMLDPACLMLAAPQLLFAFIYERPHSESLMSLLKDSVRLIGRRDPCLAATMCRKFYWHALNLWPEDIPEGAVVFVGGRDVLLPHQAIRKQMEEYGKHITCIYDAELEHSHILGNLKNLARVFQHMREWM